MTWELPWITSGIDEFPVGSARVMTYAATDGNSGVVGGSDLKVTATSGPSAQVQIAAGVLVATTRYSGASLESYTARNNGVSTVTVPSTGGTSRYDFVYAHITDPGQTGEPTTAAPVEVRVITGVSSTATKMSDVGALANVTGVPLARIFRTASSSIVNQSDITDIRSFLTSGLVGEVKIWPAAAAPSGWVICNGQALNRSTYSALFGIIGTTFGSGDGATTFNVPNLVDRAPIGAGNKALGAAGGAASVSLANHVHVLSAHTHNISNDVIPKNTAGNTSTQGSGGADRVVSLLPTGANGGQHNHGGATGSAGGGATAGMPADVQMNVQNPYLALNFIIRTT